MTPGERDFVLGHDHISCVVEMLDFFNILLIVEYAYRLIQS